MSSGGGTNTVTQQSGPPAPVLANYSEAYNQAQNVAAQPYQPYAGSTVAGFTPMQEAGFNDVNTAANAAQPFQNAAAADVTNAATTIDPSNFGGTVSQYESPYTAQVLNATEAAEMNTDAQQQQQMAGNAVSAGAWGGDRSAVLQGITAGQQAIANNATNANLENTGFQNATSAAESNAYLNSSAGAEMGALGQTAQGEGLTAANAELTAGGTQQQQEQNELNVPYQAYLAAQANPQQETNWLEGMATGTGSLSGTTGSTTSPGPSVLSQAAGLGVTGLAGYNIYNNATNGAAAANTAANNAGFVDSGAFDVEARGGRVPHLAPGGEVSGLAPMATGGATPDVSINLMGAGGNLMGAGGNLLGTGGNLLTTPTGTVSTTTGGPSGIGQLIGLGGQIAASVYGGPIAGAAAGAFNQAVGLRDGGTAGFAPHHARDIDDFAKHISGLRPVPVRPRGFDIGGSVNPSLTASVGGNPMLVQAAQTYNGLPTDQLRQMAARYPASTPQGALVARALQMRQLYPQSNPTQSTVSAPPQSAPSSPQPGIGPMGPSPYARGGETEDDDDPIPDLVIPAPGPSVPGGLAAGLSPIAQPTTTPETLLTQHAMAMGKSGSYVPPPPELAPLVVDAAQRHNVDPKALAWMLSQESHWNPNAYNPESGTIGLGQFKPATAREEGIDPRDPAQAIDGAAHYLSKQLARSGGDYETAIGHYGTFSTGHGKDADNAVRGQFRAFMQGAARGGAIHLADGGDPDYIDPSGLLVSGASASPDAIGGFDPAPSPQPVLQSPSMIAVPDAPPAAITDGSGNSIPPPTAGLGTMPKNQARASIKADPWEALLTAGLGMMAGTSPHALTNIGAGGLAGVKDYQQQKQLAIQDQTRQDVAATNAVWRAGQQALYNARAAALPQTTAATVGLKTAQAAAIPLTTAARTTTADAATTRANAAADVAAATVPLRQNQAAAVPVNTQTRATTAATGQASLALRQQALQALIQQRGITNDRNAQNDAANQVNKMTNEQLAAITAGKDPMGIKPSPTPQQAGATVDQLRTHARQSMPQPTVAAPTAQPVAPVIPPGLPPGAQKAPDGNYYVPNPNGGWLKAVPAGG